MRKLASGSTGLPRAIHLVGKGPALTQSDGQIPDLLSPLLTFVVLHTLRLSCLNIFSFKYLDPSDSPRLRGRLIQPALVDQ